MKVLNMPGVSVIIPSYNRAKYIGEAINSVLKQDYSGEIEVIVSDDGSTDDTIKIANSYNRNVHVLIKPDNCKSQGASAARNRGIIASSNPYILFLDSDDYYLPNHLQNMVNAMESEIGLGYVFCRLLELDEQKNENLFKLWSKTEVTPRDIAHLNVSKHNVVHTNGFLFKREVFEKAGFFDENLFNAEDIDLWMRINELYRGVFSDHFGAVIRKHKHGQLTDAPRIFLLKCYCKVYKNAIKRYYILQLNDKFRIIKLRYVASKYRLLQNPIFYWLYYKVQKNKKKHNTLSDWHSLSYFIDPK